MKILKKESDRRTWVITIATVILFLVSGYFAMGSWKSAKNDLSINYLEKGFKTYLCSDLINNKCSASSETFSGEVDKIFLYVKAADSNKLSEAEVIWKYSINEESYEIARNKVDPEKKEVVTVLIIPENKEWLTGKYSVELVDSSGDTLVRKNFNITN